jgi:hypothetical protein
MVFVRVKRIYGQEYGYLVENSWTGKGSRQRVGKYLGKVFRPEKAKSESFSGFLRGDGAAFVQEKEFGAIAQALVEHELAKHDVKSDISVDFSAFTVKNARGKAVVVAMNDGFLCGETLRKLLEYDAGKDYSGYVLADVLTGAGLAPEQDVFVSLYGKFKAQYDAAAARREEFYY